MVSQDTSVNAYKNGKANLDSAIEQQKHIQSLAKDMQALSRSLHPAILKDLGLEAGIKAECRRIEGLKDLELVCVIDSPPDVDMATSLNLYRILQESLNNVLKHAKNASLVFVSLTCCDQHIELIIRDDGEGLTASLDDIKGSLGIISIQERALLLSGNATFTSLCEGGFEVRVTVPLATQGSLL